MKSEERRNEILDQLKKTTSPVSAGKLAEIFNVSRQVIVGDIALLRAASIKILATPKGYVINPGNSNDDSCIYVIACKHDADHTLEELYTIVDYGGEVIDVIVEHPIYGQLTGYLNVSSRYDADQFVKNIEEQNTKPLSDLTDGIHLHNIKCKDKSNFELIKKMLCEKGYLL
ncbi:MAG: transcription repressor NadR [Peptostreptococcaceae bacterium]|nr:transcription repressor NadR [Peptostreptococcaceae bacterium]